MPPGTVPGMAPPPGYTAYGLQHTGFVKASAGRSKAMVILYWCVSAMSVILIIALYHRKDVWETATRQADLDAANGIVAGLALVQVCLVLASAILTCLWAKRIAENAQARGAMNVKPGMAAGGWFIPIGWWWLGFQQLRRSVQGVGGNAPSLGLWQGLFVAQSLIGFRFQSGNSGTLTTSSQLNTQLTSAAIGAALYIAATIFAGKTAKQIDDAVTGPA